MIGLLLAIACAIFIAFSQISLRKSFRELEPSVAFFFDAMFGLLLWVPLALIMGVSLAENILGAVIFAVVSAVLSEAIVFFALSKGELAVTATVLASYPVYTVIFSRLLNDEKLSAGLTLFVVITIAGSLLASAPEKLKHKSKFTNLITWPLTAAVCIGLSDTLSKGFINRSGDFSFLFMLGFVQIPVAIAYLRIEKQQLLKSLHNTVDKLDTYKFAILGGLFNIVGTGFLWLSFSYAPASIVSPVTGANGALTVILAHFAFSERLSYQKYVGVVLTFIGVIGILVLRT